VMRDIGMGIAFCLIEARTREGEGVVMKAWVRILIRMAVRMKFKNAYRIESLFSHPLTLSRS
jgi:hypothetical protein